MRTHSARYKPNADKSLVGFVVGSASYAIPIHQVREVMNPLPVSRLPHAAAAVAGVAHHRGEITAIIDLRIYFRVEQQPKAVRPKWILTRGLQAPVGFLVDQVVGVMGADGQELLPPPRVAGADSGSFLGVFSHDGSLTFVIDARHFERVAQSTEYLELERDGQMRRLPEGNLP